MIRGLIPILVAISGLAAAIPRQTHAGIGDLRAIQGRLFVIGH